MKRVLLIGTGGTISSDVSDSGLVPSLSADSLVAMVPEIKAICDVEAIQLISMDSTNICPDHWLRIANCIRTNYSEFDGFVITHGTDTMSYTAAGLSYLIQNSSKPIILTGAQIPISEKNTDASRNLIDAFTYAAEKDSHGVQVVFSGSVILGTRARKNYTKRFDAFSSVNFPEIARIQGNQILRFVPVEFSPQPVFFENLNANVGIMKITPGLRRDVLQYLLASYDALVIESFGVGGIPEYSDFFSDIRSALENGKFVVLTTQVPNEGSDLQIYRVGNILKNRTSIMEAYDMTSEAALAKLMWILGQTKDAAVVHKLFYSMVCHDILHS